MGRSTQRRRASGDRGRRPSRWLWILLASIVAADQVTKAAAPRSWVVPDPATGTYLPSIFRDQYARPVSGALLDAAAVCVLALLLWLVVNRLRGRVARLGAMVLLAGLSGNLLDRLGLSSVTQGISQRAVVNWFRVGVGPVQVGNVADVCYLVGGVLLVVGLAARLASRRGLWRTGVHGSRRPVWRAVALAVVAGSLAVAWTGFWQGDRRAAVASRKVQVARADLKATLADLDQAVLTAYVHGDPSAARLLPRGQWIICGHGARQHCMVFPAATAAGASSGAGPARRPSGR